MQVRATKPGYGGLPGDHQRRQPGEKFEIESRHFSDTWMEKLEGEALPPQEKGLSKYPVAELREMADARGIDHDGLKKADLAAAIEAHDNPSAVA